MMGTLWIGMDVGYVAVDSFLEVVDRSGEFVNGRFSVFAGGGGGVAFIAMVAVEYNEYVPIFMFIFRSCNNMRVSLLDAFDSCTDGRKRERDEKGEKKKEKEKRDEM